MNYQRIYDRIISRAKERKLDELVYRERHHIIPRCMNGTDDEDNLVDLTPEEHYVCHQLLVKVYPDNKKLKQAVLMMSGKGSPWRERRGVKRNKLYGWLKREIWKDGRKELECKHCNCTFTVPVHKERLFCSLECYWNEKRAKNIFTCLYCGNESSKSNRNKDRKYCNDECCRADRGRQKQSRALKRSSTLKPKQRTSNPANHITKTCMHCNKEFSVYKSLGFKQYCSKACSKEATTAALVVRTCPVCDTSFSRFAHLGERTFCSLKCAYKGRSSEFV